MRRLVLGDIHGAYKALLQVFKRANFDYKKDKIIFVGDLCDGWFHTKEVIDELIKIKNLVYVYGNHDIWLLEYLTKGKAPNIWLSQGGQYTFDQFKNLKNKKKYIHFLERGKYYHIEDKDKIFVHGGLQSYIIPVEEQQKDVLLWDRYMWEQACFAEKEDLLFKNPWKEIYIGHTSTRIVQYDKKAHGDKPMKSRNVWNVDTGAGWAGKLTLMDIDTKEYWQSDVVKYLYPADHIIRLREAGYVK